eukprot:scaffold96600_cov63-Phaeocystis_antarctica.AAC.6
MAEAASRAQKRGWLTKQGARAASCCRHAAPAICEELCAPPPSLSCTTNVRSAGRPLPGSQPRGPCHTANALSHLGRAPAGHIFRTWKKRWFVLEEQLLKYYKAADESLSASAAASPDKVGDSDMKGCISIQSCKVVALAPADAGGKTFCFQLTPISGKIFFICAADEESRDSWMEAIRANAELRPGEAAV